MQKIQRIENLVNCVKDNVNLLDQVGVAHLALFFKRNEMD